jgi:predicted nucleic acid-binding protein
MPASPRRLYFDANVFLAYISNESGRADVVLSLFEEARRNEVEIVTSVLSIAEVAYGAHERDTGLNAQAEAEIDRLWEPNSPITLLDVSEVLARDSRKIMRSAKETGVRGVRSVDALHLAAAGLHSCSVFHTYEKESTRAIWQGLIGMPVSEPATDRPQLDI